APLDAERLVTLAHEQRLDLQAAARAVDAAQARVQLAWRQVFPEIAIGVQTERFNERHQLPRRILADTARSSIAAGQLTAPPIQPRSERQRVRGIENNDIITGPSLSAQLPIFDQNQAQIAKAEFAYEQAAKGYQSLDISLTQDVRTAAASAATAWDVARFYHDRSMPLAQRNIDLSVETYRAGKATLLEVLQLQEFLLETRSKYVAALFDVAT